MDTFDEFVIHRDDLALLLLGKSDVQAVVECSPCLGGNLDGAGHEWDVGMKAGTASKDLDVEGGCVADGDRIS